MQINSIAHVLEIFGITQRLIAERVGVSQSQISRNSVVAWVELDDKFVVKVLDEICKEVGTVKFTVMGASGGKVKNVFCKNAEKGTVTFHPYRPNEC